MGTFLLDTFTGANGTVLTSGHTGEVGATWAQHPISAGQYTIQDNRIYCSAANLVYATVVPPSADYIIEADYHYLTSAGTLGIIGRLSTAAVTGYMFRWSANLWQLFRIVAGAFTEIASASAVLSAGVTYAIKLELQGATQRGYVDGVQVCSASDATITAAGFVGLRDGTISTTTGRHLARIEASEFPVAGSNPVIRIGQSHIGPMRVGRS